MCGIFGVYNQKSKKKLSEDSFRAALKIAEHRGPDASGVSIINHDTGLGHLRLSIIDLSAQSNQPFQYKNLHLTFNGEIFNYLELREQLIQQNYQFETESDTEVLIKAYHHWGKDCVKYFNGMWAFAIYDEEKDELFASRDRFGIKPFNYAYKNGQFIFASEIKSILVFDDSYRQPNYNAIANYCRESIGAQASESWFKGVFRLAAAHNIIVTRKGYKIERYWDYPKDIDDSISYSEACKKYLELFEDAVKIRMRSDVPIGATLSSGVDSSAIVSYIEKNYQTVLNTYTASFPNQKYDEFVIVEKFAKQLNICPFRIEIQYDNYIKELQKILFHVESGHSSPAIFPLHQITRKAKEEITVFLEGQGADEMMAGYTQTIFIDYLIDLIKSKNYSKAWKEWKAFKKDISIKSSLFMFVRINASPKIRKEFRRFYQIEGIYAKNLATYSTNAPEIANRQYRFSTRLNNLLVHQHSNDLVNLLHYGDAISMSHSLENRLPFMDYRLVEFFFKLPFDFKIRNALGKFIHRDTMTSILPEFISKNPVKIGFLSPLDILFQKEKDQRSIIEEYLLSEKLEMRGLFKREKLKKLIALHQNGKRDFSRLLYRILSVELWFQIFIDKPIKLPN